MATFHTYSAGVLGPAMANGLGARRRMVRGLHARIAVSEAASWTARRFYGGRYSIVPNGVHAGRDLPAPAPRREGAGLRIAFVGQAVERKGLPLLLAAFQGLREHVDAELVIVGAAFEEVEPLLLDRSGITVLGKVDDDRKHEVIAGADVLCAPSLGGESFGMVLTEAFAAGTPVVASDIAGYRDVVEDGVNGILVAPGDAVRLAESLRALALEPARRGRPAPSGTRGPGSPARYVTFTPRRSSPARLSCRRRGRLREFAGLLPRHRPTAWRRCRPAAWRPSSPSPRAAGDVFGCAVRHGGSASWSPAPWPLAFRRSRFTRSA